MNDTPERPLYVYRLSVSHWPTDDGTPWARTYGPTTAAPNNIVPAWLSVLIHEAAPLMHLYRPTSPLGRVARRMTWDDDRDQFVGVTMPVIKRRNYLSASGVSELAKDMEGFGAVVHVERSKAVVWSDA